MKVIEAEKYRGFTIKIKQDTAAPNPRSYPDLNLGKMICFHTKYDLGGEHYYNLQLYEGWEDLKQELIANYEPVVILPLALLDYSGLTMKVGKRFPMDPQGWDTTSVGFILAPKKKVLQVYDRERSSEKLANKVRQILIKEVEMYNQWLNGMVYLWHVGDEMFGNYYNREELMEDAKSYIDNRIQQEIREHVDKVKNWIRNEVPLQYRKPCPYASQKR